MDEGILLLLFHGVHLDTQVQRRITPRQIVLKITVHPLKFPIQLRRHGKAGNILLKPIEPKPSEHIFKRKEYPAFFHGAVRLPVEGAPPAKEIFPLRIIGFAVHMCERILHHVGQFVPEQLCIVNMPNPPVLLETHRIFRVQADFFFHQDKQPLEIFLLP